MKPRLVFGFWLGSLDSRVAAGRPDVGGTHDIRFCSVGDLVARFLGTAPDAQGRWQIRLEPYPEAGLPASDLVVAEYRGEREGECALPAQFGGSESAYRLWRRLVRPYVRGTPREAILLIRDDESRFHARVLRREQIPILPRALRTVMAELDKCGRLVSLPGEWEMVDLPGLEPVDAEPFILRKASTTREDRIRRVLGLRGATGVEPAGVRHRRSRRLAEELKHLYGFRCQLCSGEIPRIHIGGARYYVEVHHLRGLAEVDAAGRVGSTQEESDLALDRAKNLIVVCPHHHAVLHYAHGGFTFDAGSKQLVAPDGTRLGLMLDEHL